MARCFRVAGALSDLGAPFQQLLVQEWFVRTVISSASGRVAESHCHGSGVLTLRSGGILPELKLAAATWPAWISIYGDLPSAGESVAPRAVPRLAWSLLLLLGARAGPLGGDIRWKTLNVDMRNTPSERAR